MMALVQQWQAVTAQRLDLALFLPALALALIGYIMITSASMDVVAVHVEVVSLEGVTIHSSIDRVKVDIVLIFFREHDYHLVGSNVN